MQSRERQRRRRITPDRFEYERLRLYAGRPQLLGGNKPIVFVADDDRRKNFAVLPVQIARQPQRSRLQHRIVAVQREQLLRVLLPRQAATDACRAAAQDDGLQHHGAIASARKSLNSMSSGPT